MKKIIIISLFVATNLLGATGYAVEPHQVYRLYFPNIDLSKEYKERIEQVRIKVSCGHIKAITNIPDDWNIEIRRAISAVEEFHASAGHGASMLKNINNMDGSVQVQVGEKGCFDISATLLISGMDKFRQVELPLSKLRLLP